MSEPIDFAFVHGAGQGGWVWDEAIDALRPDNRFGRAIALDVPGCGAKRDRSTAGIGPDEIAAELIGDIETAGMSKVVLVGHSLAGAVLPRMIQRRPDLFRRAVYVSAAAPRPGHTVRDREGDLPGGASTDVAPASASVKLHPKERVRRQLSREIASQEVEAFVAKLGKDAWPKRVSTFRDWRYDRLEQTPSSYMVCLRDEVLSVARQEVLAARLQVARRVRMDAGHQVMNTRPHAFAGALLREAGAE